MNATSGPSGASGPTRYTGIADTAGPGIAGPTTMDLIPVRCPKCCDTNVGTEEELIGTALVRGFDPQTGEFEYTGETIVYYEGSVTQTSDDGRTLMFCRDCCTHFLFDPPAPAPPPAQVDKLPCKADNQREQPCKPDGS